MITAGHSLVGAEAVSVSFDKGPISYALKDGKIVYYGADKIYDGRIVAYDPYNFDLKGNKEYSTSDIGLIILDEAITGVKLPSLPEVGFADTLSAKTDLKIVGYGLQYQTTPRNNGVEKSWTGTVSQNSVTVQSLSANFAGSDKYLKLTANPSQGKGGVAFGDSGGPVIYTNSEGKEVVVAVNAYVTSINCGGVSYHTRIDTSQVLDWINPFLLVGT